MTRGRKQIRFEWIAIPALISLLSFARTGIAQDNDGLQAQAAPAKGHDAKADSGSSEYRLGPGDIVSITVLEAPEYGGKVRVGETGDILLAALRSPVHAGGLTVEELSRAIQQAFVEAKQLRDPSVSVQVDEYHSYTVSVTGAVAKPSVYPIPPHTTLLEALALAGGVLPRSGKIVSVARGEASAEATGTPVGSVMTVDLSRLTGGNASSANVEVRKGDVINVSDAAIVYVVGAVVKPGGFQVPDPNSGLSVLQALANAEGTTSIASTHHSLIIRQSTSSTERQEIPVDLTQMLSGKGTDMVLAPNDILYVPDSRLKQTLKVMGDVAMAAVNGIAVYGIGYRVGGIP